MLDVEARTRYVLGDGGALLLHRHWRGERRAPSVFVGHSQPTHSGNVTDIAAALARSGFDVHAGDLRGHGGSVSARQPLGHLDRHSGWQQLISDMQTLTEIAFENVPWEDRMMVVPNISALLTLELLKIQPDLCRNIVLISPPPNQKTLWMLANAFVKARMLICDPAKPDEHTLYHLYSFLGAHLNEKNHLADVMTPDRTIIDALVADDTAWPTPTLAYWTSIFGGFQNAWQWPRGAKVKPGTRILLMYGGEDPMMGLGSFIDPMKAWFGARGLDDVSAYRVEGARSALFLDEKRLSVSQAILSWHRDGKLAEQEAEPTTTSIENLSSRIVRRFANDTAIGNELNPEDLVELCYTAIDDEGRLTEIMYRLALAISRDDRLDAAQVEQLVSTLMPHWDRSYKINRQILDNAAIGVVLQSVIERFEIGVAMLSDTGRPVFFNDSYRKALQRCASDVALPCDESVAKATENLLRRAGIGASAQATINEAVIVVENDPVGFYFRPPVLRQTGLLREGPSTILVLRNPSDRTGSTADNRLALMQLAYGLTQQEANVALKIAAGLSPEQTAAELGVSIHTVRTHLKRNYEKMGVQGQTALVSRIMSGPIGWLGA